MIKQFATALILGTALLCGAHATPAGVPKGATATGPDTYRFVDKDMKVWIYRRTPFGFQRSSEDKTDAPAAASTTPDPSAGRTVTPFGESKPSNTPVTRVTEDGDSLKFERPTPFGNVRWTRKKSELNDDERKLWEAQRNSPAPSEKK